MNENHKVIGLEILDASKFLHINLKYLINHQKVITGISVVSNGIFINLSCIGAEVKTFKVLFDNNLSSSFIFS